MPHKFARPRYSARQMPAMEEAEMDKGRTQAIDAELIDEVESGWMIPGWKNAQPDPTHAERQDAYRRRKSAKTGGGVTLVTVGDGCDASDGESRSEERRGEERREEPPAGTPPWDGVAWWDSLSCDDQYEKALALVDAAATPGVVSYIRNEAKAGKRWAKRVCGARSLK